MIPPADDTDALYSHGCLVVRERRNPDAWIACRVPVAVVE